MSTTLLQSDLPGLTLRHRGKVRDVFDLPRERELRLDYAGVRAFLDEQDLQRDERREVFAGIQACERATLDVWAEQREREQQERAGSGPPVPGRI